MAQYPTTAATFTTKQDGQGQYVFAAHMNAVQTEITALTTALLTTGLAHHLLPSTTNARDLGSTSTRWRDLYLAGNATIAGNATVNQLNYTTLNPAISTFSGNFVDLDFTGGNVHSIPTLAIVNADIDAGAAIAYSKLSLTGGIVNADINASAAIVYSKLSLSNSIVNADINTSAAIAWSKVSKTGSSLADLTTRSAGDLSSGTLLDARLSSNVPLKDAANTFTEGQTMDFVAPSDDGAATPTVDRVYRDNVCNAWARINYGGGSPSVTSDYNVASVTFNGTGDLTVNFATALASANYGVLATLENAAPVNSVITYTARATGSVQFITEDNNSPAGGTYCMMVIGR